MCEQKQKSRHRSQNKNSQSGLTLLELLIAMTISVMVVLLAFETYRVVARTATKLETTQRFWPTESFLRAQLAHQDSALNMRFPMIEGRYDSLRFITQRSARSGYDGGPVFVEYRFDRAKNALIYKEQPLPAWWISNLSLIKRDLRQQALDKSWESVFIAGINQVQFDYWDTKKLQWSPTWNQAQTLPKLIRLRYRRNGQEEELVAETAVIF